MINPESRATPFRNSFSPTDSNLEKYIKEVRKIGSTLLVISILALFAVVLTCRYRVYPASVPLSGIFDLNTTSILRDMLLYFLHVPPGCH